VFLLCSRKQDDCRFDGVVYSDFRLRNEMIGGLRRCILSGTLDTLRQNEVVISWDPF
jgi:hypothetical protein